MIRRRFLALIALPVLTALSPAARAQRATPVGVTPPASSHSTALYSIPSDRHGVSFSDTAQKRPPRATPFVLGGAVLGAVIGGVLAASYSPCSGDPDPGVYCTSTDPATGIVIGIGVGAAAGLLVWALIRSRPSAS